MLNVGLAIGGNHYRVSIRKDAAGSLLDSVTNVPPGSAGP